MKYLFSIAQPLLKNVLGNLRICTPKCNDFCRMGSRVSCTTKNVIGAGFNRRASLLFFLFLISSSVYLGACGNSAMNREYQRIKSSGLSGDALRIAMTEFELKNAGHFDSKIDLGCYYMLTGNTEKAMDYFRRAEALESAVQKNAETKKNTAILYGSMARIYLLQSDYGKAMDYAMKAVSSDEETGAQYRFLQAHILTAQDKQEQALALFDELYQAQANLMAADDILAFMYLLSKVKRYGDCARMADLYFEKGAFFGGLGLFASGAYEMAGQPHKAILAAFLDYEYLSGYTETDSIDFLNNIDILEKQLALKGIFAETEPVLRLVRSLYDDSSPPAIQKYSGFFAEDYIILKKKILTHSLSPVEFEQYLQLERYFTRFPQYYWNVWQAALDYSPAAMANYIPVLEKIIRLDKDGPYARTAWEELTRLMGYEEK